MTIPAKKKPYMIVTSSVGELKMLKMRTDSRIKNKLLLAGRKRPYTAKRLRNSCNKRLKVTVLTTLRYDDCSMNRSLKCCCYTTIGSQWRSTQKGAKSTMQSTRYAWSWHLRNKVKFVKRKRNALKIYSSMKNNLQSCNRRNKIWLGKASRYTAKTFSVRFPKSGCCGKVVYYG